jgi:SAM-dependent methyltransferase
VTVPPGAEGSSGSNRWSALTGGTDGEEYAARFARLAASGADVHGEATLCASLTAPGARVLDAGCGTGRVAVRLAELGYRCVGVDSDASMLAQAQAASTDVAWVLGDLAALDPGSPVLGGAFDLVVAAGNVVPLLAEGTEASVVDRLARSLATAGLLVAGFGLDPAHLPLAYAPVDLPAYDSWCEEAGLVLDRRFATWDGAPYERGGGYAVSVHRRRGHRSRSGAPGS